MTLNECRSKSQCNVFEKWDRKNLDDQPTRIFIETVSTTQNSLLRKVSKIPLEGPDRTVVRPDVPYFDSRAEIFHCPNEEVCRRKGPKWILVV